MELLRSLAFFARGILKRIYWLLPALLLDPFDLARTLFGISYDAPLWMIWLLVGTGLFIAGALTYHELRKEVATEGVNAIVARLRKIRIVVHGRDMDLAELLLILKQPFAYGVTERTIQEVLSQIRVEPNAVLAELRLAGVIESQYIDPAPGSPVASRKSISDLPYHFYTLTEVGKRVVNRLSESQEKD